ncbi:hypothetical protein BH11BAC2_BH11BAC2_15530 [soil metagenome]
MDLIVQQLQSLRRQMEQAVVEQKKLKTEINSLRETLQQVKVDKEQVTSERELLKEQLKTIKLAQALTGSSDQDSRSLKNQINSYIREIDKCLALLNKD